MYTLLRDVALHGRTLRAGQPVLLLYASANRDEDMFESPDELRLDRHPNPHLAFGIGEHFCLGAALARMEARLFFECFSRRYGLPERAAPFERIPSNLVNGFVRMPVRLISTAN